jgi:hypothetical protein
MEVLRALERAGEEVKVRFQQFPSPLLPMYRAKELIELFDVFRRR